MKINRFREPGLSEDYIDIHYREYNERIRRIVALAGKEPMLLGKLEGEQVFLKPEEVYYFEAVDRKCFACLEEEVFQVEQGIQAVAEKYSELGFIRTVNHCGKYLQSTQNQSRCEHENAACAG